MKFENAVGSFVIFALLVSLSAYIFSDIQTTYSLTETDLGDSGLNIMQELDNTNLMSGATRLSDSILRILQPTNPLDALGALLAAGIGAAQTITGIISFPVEILGIIANFYTGWIPPIVSKGLGLLFSISIAMILLRYYTKVE